MLFNCNPKCAGKRGTTTGIVDLEQDEVVCEYCNEVLKVSNFLKETMKKLGQILRPPNKAFKFKCETCGKEVETEVKGSKLIGKNCNKQCKFKVSKFMIAAVKDAQIKEEDEKDE